METKLGRWWAWLDAKGARLVLRWWYGYCRECHYKGCKCGWSMRRFERSNRAELKRYRRIARLIERAKGKRGTGGANRQSHAGIGFARFVANKKR